MVSSSHKIEDKPCAAYSTSAAPPARLVPCQLLLHHAATVLCPPWPLSTTRIEELTGLGEGLATSAGFLTTPSGSGEGQEGKRGLAAGARGYGGRRLSCLCRGDVGAVLF